MGDSVKYDGVEVKLGEKTYIVPPLTLGTLRKLRKYFDAISDMEEGARTVSDEQIDAVITIVHAAVVRNYPDVTVDVLEDLIDFGNMEQILGAIMSSSMMVKKAGAGPGN